MNRILENGRLQIFVPLKFRSVPYRRKIVMPGIPSDGTEPIALALARAFRWQKYIDEGKFKNIRELAKAIGVDESSVARTLRLRMLSPKIIHLVVSGETPRKLNHEAIRHTLPDLWSEQEKILLVE